MYKLLFVLRLQYLEAALQLGAYDHQRGGVVECPAVVGS